jgi:hypothetical protein
MGDVSPIKKPRSGSTYKKGAIDPFTLDDPSSYNPDEFYCRSTDGHGHSKNLQVRVPPEIDGAISKVLNSGCIPVYEYSKQNFIRNAINHQLWKDQQRIESGELQRIMTRQIGLAILDARRQETKESDQLIQEFKELLEEATARTDWEKLSQIIEDGDLIIETLRGTYQSKLQQELAVYRSRLKNK